MLASLISFLIIFWWLGDLQAGLAWRGGDWVTVLVALLLTMLALHLIVTPAAHRPSRSGGVQTGSGVEN